MKNWKQPEVSSTNREFYLTECGEAELDEINGGVKIGVCVIVGLGGNTTTLQSPVMTGICYVIGI